MGQSLTRNGSKNDFTGTHELVERIQDLRQTVFKKIEEHSKKYGQDIAIINNEEVDLFLHQIKNKMILVAIVGEGSAGKSTLVNSILRDKFLPSGIGRVTGVRIFIGHDPNVHPGLCESTAGPCSKCPFLVKGLDNTKILCRGAKDIESRIDEVNQEAAQTTPLVLHTYIPVFASLNSSSHCTPYLVDSPGVEIINEDVQSYYKVLSTMVYVENYQRLLLNKVNIRKELGFKQNDASLVFAVSHFDNYFRSFDERNPNEEGTKDLVASTMNIARDDVFTVCGKWALDAYLTLRHENANAAKAVDQACTDYTKHRNLEGEDKALSLLSVTGLNEIEERLKESVFAIDVEQWNISIYRKCQDLLQGPIKIGKKFVQEIKTKKASIKRDIKKLGEKKEQLKILEEHVQHSSSNGLEQSFQKKLTSFESIVNSTLDEFCGQCKGKVRETYKFVQFLTDMKHFQEHTFPVTEEKVNDEAKQCFEDLKCILEEKYKMLINLSSDQDSSCVAFTVSAEPLQSCSFNMAFNSIEKKIKNETSRANSWTNTLILGVGTLGAFSAARFSPAIASLLGLAGVTYAAYRKWGRSDNETQLSEKMIDDFCKIMSSEIESSTKQQLHEIVLNTLCEYNESLKDEYDRLWKGELDRRKKEANDTLDDLSHEKNDIKQAIEKLENNYLSLKELLGD